MKKRIAILLIIFMTLWTLFRIASLVEEARRPVFNAHRDFAAHGVPVRTMTMTRKTGVLYEPVHIANNRAVISCARTYRFAAGQQISGGGRITGVILRPSLDTGMCAITTRDAPSGDAFVEISHNGFFIPNSAIRDGVVMLKVDGVATPQVIGWVSSDARTTVVSNLNDVDIVVLSIVDEGIKIRSLK